MTESRDWEPSYGFCANDTTTNEHMAYALEMVRRRICGYFNPAPGEDRCDCKYGISEGSRGSEQTGCPELRQMIHRLLHRPGSFVSRVDGKTAYVPPPDLQDRFNDAVRGVLYGQVDERLRLAWHVFEKAATRTPVEPGEAS